MPLAPLPPSLAAACLLLVSTALAPLPASAQVEGYRIDQIHTRIVFALDHAGFSSALGTVSGSSGTLVFDPDDWSTARLDVQVPLQRIDLGNDEWNRAAGRMLDVDRYPVARFVSDSIQPLDARHATICGTLTLHGIARPLCLQAVFNQAKRAPVPPFRHTIGFSATAIVPRADFGIDTWKSIVGNRVDLRIEVEAVRDPGALQAQLETSP